MSSILDLDPDNDPWYVTTLGDYLNQQFISTPNIIQNCKYGGKLKVLSYFWGLDRQPYVSYFIRLYAPLGYVVLGDIFISVDKSNVINQINNLPIIFLKSIYAKKITSGTRQEGEDLNSHCIATSDGSYGFLSTNNSWFSHWIYRPLIEDFNYIPIGITIGLFNGNTMIVDPFENNYAINKN